MKRGLRHKNNRHPVGTQISTNWTRGWLISPWMKSLILLKTNRCFIAVQSYPRGYTPHSLIIILIFWIRPKWPGNHRGGNPPRSQGRPWNLLGESDETKRFRPKWISNRNSSHHFKMGGRRSWLRRWRTSSMELTSGMSWRCPRTGWQLNRSSRGACRRRSRGYSV